MGPARLRLVSVLPVWSLAQRIPPRRAAHV